MKCRQGVGALLWVLGVVAILIVMVSKSMHWVHVEETIADGERLERLSETAFRNVTEIAIWHLQNDRRVEQERIAAKLDEKASDWVKDNWNRGPKLPWIDPDDPEVLCRWRMIDANSRLNLGNLVDGSGTVSENTRLRLLNFMNEMKIPESEALVQSLCDWVDRAPPEDGKGEIETDHNAFEEGARNAPLTLLSELRMVPGFTDKVLWGSEEDGNLGFASWVTLHANGNANANTAPPWVIMGLHHQITRSNARGISEGRESRPYTENTEIADAAGTIEGVNVESLMGTTSERYILEMEADYRGRRLKRRIFLTRDSEGKVEVNKIERVGWFKWDDEVLEEMDEAIEELMEEVISHNELKS